MSPRATLSTPFCTLWKQYHLGLLERTGAVRLQQVLTQRRAASGASATLTASAENDTASSARLPSQRPVRTAQVQGGTPNSGTLLPWLISPTCPRSLFVFDGLSRQSADSGQTVVNFVERHSSAAPHCDDMCCWRSPSAIIGNMHQALLRVGLLRLPSNTRPEADIHALTAVSSSQ